MDPIARIIKHISSVRYETLPPEVTDAAKRAVIDVIGCGIAGSSSPLGKITADMVKDWGGKKESSVLVYGNKVPAPEAAFVNAIMARSVELDDAYEGGKRPGQGHGGHFNVVVIPAALAMAQSSPGPISGKQLIQAIAVGGDLLVRLRLAAGEAGRVGWITETLSPFAVVAAGAKLFNLSEDILANAMGTAYSFCSGNILSTSDGSWDIWLVAGIGARGGIVSIDLARRGHHGAQSPLMGGTGLYPLYFRKDFHEDILFGGMGTEFETVNTSNKIYACAKGTHHPIYTSLELMRKNQIKPEDIDHIEVKTCSYFMTLVCLNEKGEPKYEPRNESEAQFSIPFTVAAAIIKGGFFLDALTEETLHDPKILALSHKIDVKASPDKDEMMKKKGTPPADVTIFTRNGKSFTGCELYVKGHPQNPMSLEECADKFKKCLEFSAKPLSAKSLDNFFSNVESLEKLDDVRGLITELKR